MRNILNNKPFLQKAGFAGLLLLFFLGSNSCIKDYDFDNFHEPEWNPNIAIPLINSKLTIADILNEYDSSGLVHVGQDNFLTVYHISTVVSEFARDHISLDDQNEDTAISLIHPAALAVGDSISSFYSFRQQFISTNNDEIDSALLKAGSFNLDITTNMDHDVRVIISCPRITKKGVPLTRSITIPAATSLKSDTIDLTGYKVFFYHETVKKNLLDYDVEVVMYGDANPATGPYNLSINVNEFDMYYSKLFGRFTTRTLSLLTDSIEIGLFKKSIDGTIYLNDPKMNIYIKNSFGIPVQLIFNTLNAHSDHIAPYDVMIHGPGLPQPLNIGSPTYSQIGQTIATNIILNKTNSTFNDALNILPGIIEYGITGTINPGITPPNNFVLDTSHFKIDVEVELPLEGYANGFTLLDTIDFDIDSDDIDILEWLLFRINTESTFPVAAEIQVYFVDSNYVMLDSLFLGAKEIIPAATPGPPPLYKATVPVQRIVDITKNKVEIDKIRTANKIFLNARFNTANEGNQIVRFYSDNYLHIKLGTQAILNIDLKE